MKTTKIYVRKTYTSQLLAQGEDTLHSVTQTAMYLYPEDVGELARNHRSKQDEVYEWVLVTETVTPLSTAVSNALVMQGRTMSKAAREALAQTIT